MVVDQRLYRLEVVLGYFVLYLKPYRNAVCDVGIFSALQGYLAIESLWMYAVSVPESCLQKQISWYMRCERQATGKPFSPCLFFFFFVLT